MSNYKRFISYVYEYEGNIKKANRGFLKVECRNGICQIRFSLRGLCKDGDGQMKIYGFRRLGERLQGSLFHTVEILDGMMDLALSLPEGEMGKEKFSMGDLAGVILNGEEGIFYATQWDDAPLEFTGFPNIAYEAVSEEGENPDNIAAPEEADEMAQPEQLQEEPSLQEPQEDPVEATSTCRAEAMEPQNFSDGSILNCRRITFQEIKNLHPADRHLANNRFLYYGYQIFGHLLVGQHAESGEIILGVPGTYHQQECMMARMFGFPDFIRCPRRNTKSRPFGYWYRSIHPTDFYKGDGSL